MFLAGRKPLIAGVYVLIFLLALRVEVVWGAGRFELQVVSFWNSGGRLQTGACCAGPGGVCAACATFFRVCLKEFQLRISAEGPCTYGATDTPVLGGDSFALGDGGGPDGGGPDGGGPDGGGPDGGGPDGGGAGVAFSFAWPRSYTLTVEALHYSNSSVAGVLIARAVHAGVLAPGRRWRLLEHAGPAVKLRYRVRLLCAERYHGPRCTRYCRPRDDFFGHYGCNARGDKTCLEGWSGPACTTAMCRQSCSTEHGSCKVPGECRCLYGWHGDLCDQCVPYPGCVRGSCSEPWQCLCDTNYGGQLCDKDLNSCGTRHPCLNGGSCSNTGPDKYTCTCPAGASGTHCETGIDECLSLPCQHGGVCEAVVSGFRCVCPPQWTGKTCLIDADECERNPCGHAHSCRNLIGGYFCACLPGWTGQNCDTNVQGPSVLAPPGQADPRCANIAFSFNKDLLELQGLTVQRVCEDLKTLYVTRSSSSHLPVSMSCQPSAEQEIQISIWPEESGGMLISDITQSILELNATSDLIAAITEVRLLRPRPAGASADRSVPLLVAVVMVAWALLVAMALLWCLRRRWRQNAHAGVSALPLPMVTEDNNAVTTTASCTREHLRHIRNAIDSPAHRYHANNVLRANTAGQMQTQTQGAERFQNSSYSLGGRPHLPHHPLPRHQLPDPQTGKQDNREVEVGNSALLRPYVAAGPQHV